MIRYLLLSVCICLISAAINAQSTLQEIHVLIQASCVTGCHTGASPAGGLDLSGSATDTYNRLVGADPNNGSAAAKDYKLVYPNHPERSFLLHKLGASGFDHEFELESADGDPMPKDEPAWNNADIELVRQWILYGAKATGFATDHSVLIDFYNNNGLPRIDRPAAPATGEGVQIHHGPIFLNPGEEIEVLRKFTVPQDDDLEIDRIDVVLNEESHHFILYKYFENKSDNQGMQNVDGILGLFDVGVNANQIGTWQFSHNQELPPGTAYKWEEDQTLDLNYHVRNYNPDSVLAAEVFINIYTQPEGAADVEMLAELETYGDPFPFSLNIPNTGLPEILVMEQFDAGSSDTWYIWLLQAHTHKLAIDYDIFKRNADGSKGEQIYEGFYNQDYTFNQGFYDYAHPAIRKFEPFLEIKASEGLIHEATFLNDGPSSVGFGLTTDDEMFITYYHYTTSDPSTGIGAIPSALSYALFPNPFQEEVHVQIELESPMLLRAELVDFSGRTVAELPVRQLNAGQNVITWSVNGVDPGMYLIRMFDNTLLLGTGKLVKSD